MNIFREEDITLLDNEIESIKDKIESITLQKFNPTLKEMKAVMKIVLDFVKRKKRKIYGGFAMNELIKHKNPKDAFYKEDGKPADIDFYSPDPIRDMHELCNDIFEAGYTKVQGKEAMHPETYKIFVNRQDYVDISYIPYNVYKTTPFIEVNGLYLTHPSFIKIDYFRMFSDPMTSYWRIEKSYKRFNLLDQNFPSEKIDKPLKKKEASKEIKDVLMELFKVMQDDLDIIYVGDLYYNYLVDEVKPKNKNIKKVSMTNFDVILKDYKVQGNNIFKKMREKYGDKISITEYYPFFQFRDYRFEMYYGDHVILKAQGHNKKCIPFRMVNPKLFDIGEAPKKDIFIALGSFDRNILDIMVNKQYYKTNKDKDMMYYYKTMFSHVLEMRDEYFKKHNKNILDNTLFQQFLIECIGEVVTLDQERQEIIEKRKKKRQPFFYTYEPSNKVTDGSNVGYKFFNSSGNVISNPRNLRLGETIPLSDSDDDSTDDEFIN